MFPLGEQAKSSSTSADPAVSTNFFMLLQPSNGPHTEDYTIYRRSYVSSPAFHRMTQRGATVIGVDEDTLRYSIRWIESKLKRLKANLPISRSSDLRCEWSEGIKKLNKICEFQIENQKLKKMYWNYTMKFWIIIIIFCLYFENFTLLFSNLQWNSTLYS